jgi:hypothetical protein
VFRDVLAEVVSQLALALDRERSAPDHRGSTDREDPAGQAAQHCAEMDEAAESGGFVLRRQAYAEQHERPTEASRGDHLDCDRPTHAVAHDHIGADSSSKFSRDAGVVLNAAVIQGRRASVTRQGHGNDADPTEHGFGHHLFIRGRTTQGTG